MTACIDEQTASAWVDGLLDDGEIDAVERHLDGCDDCGQFVAALARLAESPELAGAAVVGDRLGRYQVIEPLGSGAMGLVYRAHDTELERDVALKLLRDPGADNRRLLVEARAMARLEHPNAVAVHDIGEDAGEVFVAMELVSGATVREWLRDDRSWREVVEVFIGAARGLDAAHRAGLVHRDIKPDNLMITGDGRVKVGDFGLATAAGDGDRAGVGTPIYMAPEQAEGAATPASDQFSLAVALWEALAGRRPFAGDTVEAIQANVLAGELRGKIRPAWLERALRRALRAKAGERFPSMAALIAELERGLGRGRRRWALVAGAMVAAAAIAVAIAWPRPRAATACAAIPAELAPTWNPERRARLVGAIAEGNPGYAKVAGDAVAARIDERARRWVAARTAACEEAERQPLAVVAARSGCLTESIDALGAAIAVLEGAGPTAAIKGAEVIDRLDPIDRCADAAGLARLDPAIAGQRRELAESVAAGFALHDLGRYKPALERLGDAADRAAELGDRDLEASARFLECGLRARLGDLEAAERACHKSAVAASAGGHSGRAARAWSLLIGLLGGGQARYADAEQWTEYARAALDRAGTPAAIEAGLEVSLGIVAKQRAEYAEAVAHYRRAVALHREARGHDDMRVARSLNNLAIALNVMGERDEAAAAHEEALAIKRARLGPEHPSVAISLLNLGLIHRGARDDLARPLFERALEIANTSLPEGHSAIVAIQSNLGLLEHRAGNPDKAARLIGAALESSERRHGDRPHPTVATLRDNLGLAVRALGDLDRAAELHREALETRLGLFGEKHDSVANSYNNLATVLGDRGAHRDALAAFAKALAIRESVLGADHGDLIYDLVGIGHSRIELGDRRAAIAPLERALGLAGDGVEPSVIAAARFDLARALGPGERADQLARQALETYRAAGAAGAADARAVAAFLSRASSARR